jgi:hypothetical protein
MAPGSNRDAVNPRLQYGGDQFEQACELADRFQGGAPALRGFRLDSVRALWSVMTSLPRLPVALTSTSGGRVIDRHLAARRWGVPKNRFAQGVLELFRSEKAYLRHCHRLVRRQVRRGRGAGLTCAEVESTSERGQLMRWLIPLMAHVEGWTDVLPPATDARWWVARNAGGEPVALAILVIDSEWAMLSLLKSTDHAARYLLHTEVAVSLGRAGVRYLLTDSPMVLRMDPNVRFFQRMLGYQVAHLVLA